MINVWGRAAVSSTVVGPNLLIMHCNGLISRWVPAAPSP
jgi:hypothetical protein